MQRTGGQFPEALDGVKVLRKDQRWLPFPLADGGWLLVRFSGTDR